MSERVLSELAKQLLERHAAKGLPRECECFRCRSLRDLLDARQRIAGHELTITTYEDSLREYHEKLKVAEQRIKELESRLADLRRLTHGPCCTCQRCGKFYDDCRCDLDTVADDLEKAEARVKELERGRDEARPVLEAARKQADERDGIADAAEVFDIGEEYRKACVRHDKSCVETEQCIRDYDAARAAREES